MPDITMCADENCPLKNSCYRFRVMPSQYRQSYFADPIFNKETNSCKEFWPIKEGWNDKYLTPIKPDIISKSEFK